MSSPLPATLTPVIAPAPPSPVSAPPPPITAEESAYIEEFVEYLLDLVDLAESERTSKPGGVDKMQGRIRARHDQAHRHKQERQALADECGSEKEKEK